VAHAVLPQEVLRWERIRRRIYPTREAARPDVFDCIETTYNPKRKHSNTGILSPVGFETWQRKLNAAGVREARGTST
jgi:putative transposase